MHFERFMRVHLRLVRLRGGLSCVQIIVVILAHFACWTPLVHSHEVDVHFEPHLYTLNGSKAASIHPFVDFLSKYCKPKYSLWKTEDTRRSDCPTRDLLGPKIHLVGTSCARKIIVILTQFAFWATLDHSYVLQCLAWRFQCSHHAKITESLVFLKVKLTIPRGPDLILTLKIWAHVVEKCTLNDSCGYICDLCGSVVASPVFK